MSDGRTFQREKLDTAWSDSQALYSASFSEVGISQGAVAPSRSFYEILEAQDGLRIYTARINGALVGYCTLFLSKSRFDGELEAHEDSTYILPDHRGFLGAEFQHWCDNMLHYDGVRRCFRERIIHESPERELRRGPIGYRHHSVLWKRDLEAPHGQS